MSKKLFVLVFIFSLLSVACNDLLDDGGGGNLYRSTYTR